MSRERSRRARSSALLSAAHPSNVLDFSAARIKLTSKKSHTVFYLNENLQCRSLLESLGDVFLVDIRDPEILTRRLLLQTPDLILVESSILWIDPLATIRQLTDLMRAPVVLLVDKISQQKDPLLVKKAYAAGVSDTLFLPLDREEVRQTFNVLLHFQIQASR